MEKSPFQNSKIKFLGHCRDSALPEEGFLKFTPQVFSSAEPAQVSDDPFFVMGSFNLDDEPFKFPTLAQT